MSHVTLMAYKEISNIRGIILYIRFGHMLSI